MQNANLTGRAPHAEPLVPAAMNVNAIVPHLNRLNALAAIIGYLRRYGNAHDMSPNNLLS
ncbi:MAG: hypothetical protein Q9M25_05585, partial [Mariprofundaceae bacterium]|nr:hypothetical protein [Mariprofundaceae bacterium]